MYILYKAINMMLYLLGIKMNIFSDNKYFYMRLFFIFLLSPSWIFCQMDSVQISDYYKRYNTVLSTENIVLYEPKQRVAVIAHDLSDGSYVLQEYEKGHLIRADRFPMRITLWYYDDKGSLYYVSRDSLFRMELGKSRQLEDLLSFSFYQSSRVMYSLQSKPKELIVYDKVNAKNRFFQYDYISKGDRSENVLFKRGDSVWVLDQGGEYLLKVPGLSNSLEADHFYSDVVMYDRRSGLHYWIDYRNKQYEVYKSDYLREKELWLSERGRSGYLLKKMSGGYAVFSKQKSRDIYNDLGYVEYNELRHYDLNILLNNNQNLYDHIEVYSLRDSSLKVLQDSVNGSWVEYQLLNDARNSHYWLELKRSNQYFVLDLRPIVYLWNVKYSRGVNLDSLLPDYHDYYATPDGEYVYMINGSDSLYRYRVRDGIQSSMKATPWLNQGWTRYQFNADRYVLDIGHYFLENHRVLIHSRNDLLQIDSSFRLQVLNQSLPSKASLVYRYHKSDPSGKVSMLSYDYNSSVSGMYILKDNNRQKIYENDGYHYMNTSINIHEIRFNDRMTKNKGFVLGKDYVLYFESYNDRGEYYVLKGLETKKREEYRIPLLSGGKPFAMMGTRHLSVREGNVLVNASMYYPVDFDSSKQYPVVMQTYLRNTMYRNVVVHPIWNYATNEFVYRNLTYDGYIVVDVDVPLEDGDFYKYSDWLNIVNRYVRKLSYVDSTAIGLTGHSMGAAVGMGALQRDSLFHCAILFAGINSYAQFYVQQLPQGSSSLPIGYRYQKVFNDSTLLEILEPERMRSRDAYYHVEDVNTPVLLIHNRNDRNVSFWNTAWFYIRAKLLGKENIQLIEFKSEGHTLSKNKYDKDGVLVFKSYFRRYLKK